jgi:hypothetical protein
MFTKNGGDACQIYVVQPWWCTAYLWTAYDVIKLTHFGPGRNGLIAIGPLTCKMFLDDIGLDEFRS